MENIKNWSAFKCFTVFDSQHLASDPPLESFPISKYVYDRIVLLATYPISEGPVVQLRSIDAGNFRHLQLALHTWSCILMQVGIKTLGKALKVHKVLGKPKMHVGTASVTY